MIELAYSVNTHDREDLDVFGTLALQALERSGTITIEKIETLAQLDAIKADFERIYAADPYRTTFVSWEWLRAYFSSMAGTWQVLAARSRVQGGYIAFLPLELRQVTIGPIVLDSELYFGINPTGDYTGLVMAENSWDALEAFALEIDRMPWDNFHVHNVVDPRVHGIVNRLRRRNRVVLQAQNACRFIPLPGSWDAYLRERLTYNRRGKMRSIVRTLKRIPGFRFEEASTETIDEYVTALLRLNHERWQTNLAKAHDTYGALFRHAFQRGVCRIFIAWKDEEPIAAQAAFIDPDRRSWDVYMLGYNAVFGKFSPGVGIIALTMQQAIAEGYSTFDFLRGEESYKERFATEVRLLDNWIVRRNGARNFMVKAGRFAYYTAKAQARRILFGKPLSTSSYCV